MINMQDIQRLTSEQILQLNKALESFNCGGIFCDYCPMRMAESVPCKFPNAEPEYHHTACFSVYIAFSALEIKSTV